MIDPYEYKPGYWWLSFAGPRSDPDYAGPRGFLGVVIVFADTFDDALGLAWALKLNPGGAVQASLLEHIPDSRWCSRLLTKELIEEMGTPKH
jgi:hypothetical protein